MNYVHGIHRHGNHNLIESYHISIPKESSSGENATAVVYNKTTQNNKNIGDSSIASNSSPTPVIKTEAK